MFRVSPAAKHYLALRKIKPNEIVGSGKKGMILKEDVLLFKLKPIMISKTNVCLSIFQKPHSDKKTECNYFDFMH